MVGLGVFEVLPGLEEGFAGGFHAVVGGLGEVLGVWLAGELGWEEGGGGELRGGVGEGLGGGRRVVGVAFLPGRQFMGG